MFGGMTMRPWTGGMVLIFTCGVLPVPIRAQAEGDGEGRQQVGCFRGRPLPVCKSFWIFEMQGNAPLVQTEGAGGKAFDNELEWNLGHMVNVDSTYAIGGVVTVGTGNDNALTGLKLRGRRWLRSDLSLEAEGGLVWKDATVGGTAALRLNIRDQGSFYLRWDMLPNLAHGAQHALSLGVGTGSVPALITSGAAGLAVLIIFTAYVIGIDSDGDFDLRAIQSPFP